MHIGARRGTRILKRSAIALSRGENIERIGNVRNTARHAHAVSYHFALASTRIPMHNAIFLLDADCTVSLASNTPNVMRPSNAEPRRYTASVLNSSERRAPVDWSIFTMTHRVHVRSTPNETERGIEDGSAAAENEMRRHSSSSNARKPRPPITRFGRKRSIFTLSSRNSSSLSLRTRCACAARIASNDVRDTSKN